MSSSRRRLLIGAVLVCLTGIGLWGYGAFTKPPPPPPAPAIPVVAQPARQGDVPVYFTGIGTVQAYNTVTVKFQVTGVLTRVAFVEGQDVKAGDLLAQIDPRPFQAQLDQVVAAKARDEAILANAKLDLARYQRLVTEKSIAVQQRDQQLALVQQDAATVQTDQAQIDYARTQLGFTALTSPIDGRTGIRMIDEGNLIQSGDTTGLVVVTQIEPISLLFTLPEDDFAPINRRMAAGSLTVVALNRSDGSVLGQGTLLLVNNQIDPTTGTIQLKATFPNKDHALWPGQFIDAKLLVETRHDVVTIPAAAVQRGPQGLYAYVVKPDDTVEMRSLKIAAADAGIPVVVVESGLNSGDRVVVDGQLKLHPNVRVKVSAPAQQQAAAPP